MHDGQPIAGPSSSGLTLVIPSLKALKDKAKKARSSPVLADAGVKKTPRPLKLKPLKEVLTPLIAKIKKKDDYAFFLNPVDQSLVQGYSDVIKRPMDFGTMTTKVERGKYRSLEDFAADFHLVISNAKAFNPPGTIYHTEADRIEAWATEHISKASAQVIEYEVDWNIDVERDEDPNVNVDAEEEDGAVPGGSGRGDTPARRSPSAVSSSVPPPARRPRGAGNKNGGALLSDLLEPDGHLPGYKDGLGAFPPGSDWAATMVALKIKGKRYRTKKERLRFEREGPPHAPDGSLDYGEMEDPFTVLSALVPEPMTRPELTPIYPPSSTTDGIPVPTPVNRLVPEEFPTPPSLGPAPTPTPSGSKPKLRYWTITRHAASRARAKEKEEDEPPPPPKPAREPTATDFGPYATLASQLAKERDISPESVPVVLGTEEKLFDVLMQSVSKLAPIEVPQGEDYWTAQQAHDAQRWVRDMVYGGTEGLAYVRSIAEFVSGAPVNAGALPLGMSLAEYVEARVIDPLTAGRHRILHDVATHLASASSPAIAPGLVAQVQTATEVMPALARALTFLKGLSAQPLDLAALIRAPQELFDAESVWAAATAVAGDAEDQVGNVDGQVGGALDAERASLARGLRHAASLFEQLLREREAEGWKGKREDGDGDGDVKMAEAPMKGLSADDAEEKDNGKEKDMESPVEKELRLNLVALAKRAPLDQIAKMPAELVPAHLRHVVPTIGF
ncbi:hypothetical protein OF83DRAFT_1141054 [Amylostereum chailletii]|nr:hypothetical protein OF83DRAFT_1141054 [Amylostereum chailletii]